MGFECSWPPGSSKLASKFEWLFVYLCPLRLPANQSGGDPSSPATKTKRNAIINGNTLHVHNLATRLNSKNQQNLDLLVFISRAQAGAAKSVIKSTLSICCFFFFLLPASLMARSLNRLNEKSSHQVVYKLLSDVDDKEAVYKISQKCPHFLFFHETELNKHRQEKKNQWHVWTFIICPKAQLRGQITLLKLIDFSGRL